jgi:hypothetical protein
MTTEKDKGHSHTSHPSGHSQAGHATHTHKVEEKEEAKAEAKKEEELDPHAEAEKWLKRAVDGFNMPECLQAATIGMGYALLASSPGKGHKSK